MINNNEKLPFVPNIPALNQALTLAQIQQCLSEKRQPLSRRIQGTTADIDQLVHNPLDVAMSLATRLNSPFGRSVGGNGLLVKIAKADNRDSALSYTVQLRREVEMTCKPEIQPFAVVTSSVQTDPVSGRACIIEEKASGLNFLEPQDAAKLAEEDLARIVFQILMVSEAFHLYGASTIDIGKDFYYYKFPNEYRVLLYDLAYAKNIPSSGKDRVKAVIRDIQGIAMNLNEFLLAKVPEAAKARIVQWLGRMEEPKFQTFSQLATSLDQDFGGPFGVTFSNQHQRLTGKRPEEVKAHEGRFTQADIAEGVEEVKKENRLAAKDHQRWTSRKHLLESLYNDNPPFDPPTLMSLQSDDALIMGRFAGESRILAEIDFGRTTRSGLTQALAKAYNEGHPVRHFFETKATDGRTLLDHLLDKLADANIITNS